MNTWLAFILFIIFCSFILEWVVSLLNLRALTPKLPEEFAGVYNADEYAKSQDYTRTTTRFSLLSSTITTFATVAFLLAGGFNHVDLLARSFQLGDIWTGLVFSGILAMLSFLLNLPFSLYSTFVIEGRFGFNRTTTKTFLLDILKATLLMVILGGPLLALILWFFAATGSLAWLYCWIGVVCFSIIVQFLAPVLILPLFNKFTPLEDSPLKKAILKYADKEQFKIQGIFTMDGSKRSTKLNAFFTGFGQFRKIVFYDTLMEKLSDTEIIAVLAHEMGHFKLKHIFKMLTASIVQTGIMFYLLSCVLNNSGLFEAFGMEHISIYASLIFFSFLYSPVSLLISIAFNYFSRKHEFEADAYAAMSTGETHSLVHALKTLSQANLSNLTPHKVHVFLHHSHPPVLERIRALRMTALA